MVLDIIVIGGGPAGLTAGIYARTRNLSTLILEGEDLGQMFVEHARVNGCEIREGETVERVKGGKNSFLVTTNKGTYEGRTIILAIGNGLFNPRRLGIPGEAEFEGNGVHYRVRDRRDFKNKRVLFVFGWD